MARRARASPYDLLDPRQRLAIAILIAAVRLPAPLPQCSKLFLEAARVLPGLKVDQAYLGNRALALKAARDLIDEVIANPDPQPDTANG